MLTIHWRPGNNCRLASAWFKCMNFEKGNDSESSECDEVTDLRILSDALKGSWAAI